MTPHTHSTVSPSLVPVDSGPSVLPGTGRTLTDRLYAARNHAVQSALPMRRKDRQLYGVLAECLGICQDVIRDKAEGQLRDAVRVSVDERNPEIWGKGRAAGNAGRGKRYAERTSDAYVLVCRFVLEGSENYATRSRYAAALREAAKRQIAPDDLVNWLASNGGVRALYLRRPNVKPVMSSKTLYLNSPVTFRAGEAFTVTLQYDGIGGFHVISEAAQ